MKKLLSTIMALVMLLSLVPMAVAEEGVTAENAVAQIGDQYYKTLEDAVLKVANGDTITLLKDVALGSNGLNIGSVGSEQKVLTLDLNGHSISATDSVIMVQNANLTVTGPGKIYETSPNFGAIIIKGSNKAENENYTVVNIGAGVELEAWSPIFVTPFKSSGAPYAYGVVVNVDGAKLTGKRDTSDNVGSAIYVNGQIKEQNNAPKLVLNNVTQTATGAGMYLAGYANTTITGGSITGGDTGIEIRAGELTLNDCALEATAEEFSCEPNGNGATTAGAAIAIAQHTTKKDIAVTINGGSFKGVKALNESNPQVNDPAPQVKLSIDGGTFIGDISTADVTGFIKGGTFTDLASAVKYATNGATITLAGDAKGDVVIPEGKTITLDLGGHKLTNVKDHTIVNNGTLTITGTGTVDNVTHARAALVNYGTAILNGGNFTRSKENPENNKNNGGGNSYYTILNDKGATMTINEGVTVSNVGHFSSMIRNGGDDNAVSKMTINGGTFSGGINTVKNDANGDLTINGGDFSNTSQFVIMNWNKATISDGTFEANASAGAVLYTSKWPGDSTVGDLKIEGGMYVCAKNQKLIVDCYNNDDQYLGTAVISAGAFNVAPDAKYLAEGMIVVPGVKDAPYSVQPAKREDENIKSEVKVDGDNVTVTVTDKTTGTTTETVTDTTTGAETVTKTETNVDTGVKTETVTEKNAAGETTKVTESKIVENTENGKTETKTTVDGKTVKTDVTVNQAPATASDVTLNAKALEGKAAGTETSSVTVDKASLSELKNNTVKGVIIETDQATLKLNKDAVKTMENNVAANGKMTLDVTVTEETNATEITKIAVEVTAKNEAGENVFPENTANTNGLINITIPYTGNAKYLDLWYVAANGSASYMGRFPVVNGFVSFDVKHFSQYDLIPVASSGSSVIKTGAGSSAASTTQTVTTDLTPGSITKVTVDGKVVDAKYYTVSGSNVTFTAEFLKTLKNGSHTVTVENATKIAKGVFTVNNPTTAQSPTTADAGIALYAGMAIASVMGTGVVFASRKRKNH